MKTPTGHWVHTVTVSRNKNYHNKLIFVLVASNRTRFGIFFKNGDGSKAVESVTIQYTGKNTFCFFQNRSFHIYNYPVYNFVNFF